MGRGDRGWAGECKRFNTEDTEEMREGTEAAWMGWAVFFVAERKKQIPRRASG
jgi:hypothetical protein